MGTKRDLGHHYPAGAIIFSPGDVADCLYVVQKGRVEIVIQTDRGENRLTAPGPGEMFGASSLFTADKVRFTTARVLEDAHILKVDERTLISRLHQDPSLAFRLIRRMAQRIYDLDHQHIDQLLGSQAALETDPVPQQEPSGKLPNVFDFNVGYHILVVEDDDDFYQLMRLWLSSSILGDHNPLLPETVDVVRAMRLDQALSNLSRDKFDVVILDLNLPDSAGMETFNRIHGCCSDTPIVVLSGMDDERQAVQAVRRGAQDYLIKNRVDRTDLIHAMRYAIERRRHVETARYPQQTADGSIFWKKRNVLLTFLARHCLNWCQWVERWLETPSKHL
ncbi:MAG: cyclic nucleotide-binding domain-containing protein [Magnetococcales bacterium]|nr:cyclic nucleotide-binding domain-containing protein [Magnetococcales bacterium]